jgi:parallel beta-helix repeat protein
VDHSPIFIFSNDDFYRTVFQENWIGNGTHSNPYIIENLSITFSSVTSLINIQNTDVHFLIKNCVLTGGNVGIYMNNITNGQISTVTILNSTEDGIEIRYSSNMTITENVILNCGTTIFSRGILVIDTDNSNFTSNVISENLGGGLGFIQDEYPDFNISENNIISNNFFHKNRRHGLVLWSAGFFIVERNDFLDNNLGGTPTVVKSQAYDVGLNYGFNNLISHNYWDDWTGLDDNDDGIIDEPYPIDGYSNNSDPYPLMSLANPEENRIHFLIKPRIIIPNGGEELQGHINVSWMVSKDSFNHPVNYDLLYSPNAGSNWIELASGLNATNYLWNTTKEKDGDNCLIKVIAICHYNLSRTGFSDRTFSIHNNQFLDLMPFLQRLALFIVIFLALGFTIYFQKLKRRIK